MSLDDLVGRAIELLRNLTYILLHSILYHMTTTNSNDPSLEQHWYPDKVIEGVCDEKNGAYTCLVLNRKIRIPTKIVENLWENAKFRCTVDGGTNHWKNFILNHCEGKKIKPPDFITGDFDSITQETSKYFNDPEIKRIHTPDQNYTDFRKAIEVLKPVMEENHIHDIIVFHDTSGRIDHIMSNINTLFSCQSNSLNVYLLSGNSISWLLLPGLHSIHIPKDLVNNKRWCSLIPVGCRVSLTTNGLKWDMTNKCLEFGGMVSSSNTYASDVVQVKPNNCVFWAMGMFSFDQD